MVGDSPTNKQQRRELNIMSGKIFDTKKKPSNSRDNVINRLNKRIESRVKTFGAADAVYNDMISTAIRAGLEIRMSADNSHYMISRGSKNTKHATPEAIQGLIDLDKNYDTTAKTLKVLKNKWLKANPNAKKAPSRATLISWSQSISKKVSAFDNAMSYMYDDANIQNVFDKLDDYRNKHLITDVEWEILVENAQKANAHFGDINLIKNTEARRALIRDQKIKTNEKTTKKKKK